MVSLSIDNLLYMVGEQTMSGTQEGCPAKFSLLQLDANLIEGEPYNHLTQLKNKR